MTWKSRNKQQKVTKDDSAYRSCYFQGKEKRPDGAKQRILIGNWSHKEKQNQGTIDRASIYSEPFKKNVASFK